MFVRSSAWPLAAALGLAVFAAQADTSPIFTAPLGPGEASKTRRFAINPELGRAWVEIDIWHANSDSGETHRVAVPGLSYRPDSHQIVFDVDGSTVTCAFVRQAGSWIFRHRRIEPTGDCQLLTHYVRSPMDDGFRVDVVERFELHFTHAPAHNPTSTADHDGQS